MNEHDVDVIVPVHDAARPIRRAIDSIEPAARGLRTRTMVVLHGLDATSVEARLPRTVDVLRCDDRIPSPSGPRNVGLESATAEWVSFVDSDDLLGPGSLEMMVEVAQDLDVDVVLPSIWARGNRLRSPLRMGRRPQLLDIANHDLFRRSHCFGLVRRSAIVQIGARFPEAVRTSEDLVFMAQLFSKRRTGSAPRAAYVMMDDAVDRVTDSAISPDEHVAFIDPILRSTWFSELPSDERSLLVRRILAINLARNARSEAYEALPYAWVRARDRLLDAAPQATSLLSVQDAATLELISGVDTFRRKLFAMVPRTLTGLIHPAGPPRASAATVRMRCVDASQRYAHLDRQA